MCLFFMVSLLKEPVLVKIDKINKKLDELKPLDEV